MKRVLLRTLSCLVAVVALMVLASRWAVPFWLLVLSVSVYLLVGRKVALELRIGVGGNGIERRVYGALVWKRGATVPETAEQCEPAAFELGATGRHG